MPRRCFKRFSFPACRGCDRPLPLRLLCFYKYVVFHTDPTPMELFIGTTSFFSALAILASHERLIAEPYTRMWSLMHPYYWAGVMGILGLFQMSTPLFGAVNWVSKIRPWISFLAGGFWSFVACMATVEFHFTNFQVSMGLYGLASWWCFIRSADYRPYCGHRCWEDEA